MTLSGSLSLIVLLVLAGVAILNILAWRRKPHVTDIVIIVISAIAYIIISTFLWEELRAWMGTGYFALTLIYGFLSYESLKRGGDNASLGTFSLIITMILFTVALAIQFADTMWTTIAWSVEGAVLMWLFSRLRLIHLRYFSYLVFLGVVVRLLFFDTWIDIETFTPVINERFPTFILAIAAMYVTAYYILREVKASGKGKEDAAVILIAASFFTIWLFSFEMWDYFGNALITAGPAASEGFSDAQNLSLTAVWAIYAVICLVIGIMKRWRYVRLGALALLVIPIGKVFVYDVFQLELGYRIGAFVGLGVLLLVSAYLYQRYSKVIKGVFIEEPKVIENKDGSE